MHVRKLCLHSMKKGSPFGRLLQNVFKTEIEKNIIQNLIDKKFIMFYIRYVDDTLLLV